jgi:hypothetical protein
MAMEAVPLAGTERWIERLPTSSQRGKENASCGREENGWTGGLVDRREGRRYFWREERNEWTGAFSVKLFSRGHLFHIFG